MLKPYRKFCRGLNYWLGSQTSLPRIYAWSISSIVLVFTFIILINVYRYCFASQFTLGDNAPLIGCALLSLNGLFHVKNDFDESHHDRYSVQATQAIFLTVLVIYIAATLFIS